MHGAQHLGQADLRGPGPVRQGRERQVQRGKAFDPADAAAGAPGHAAAPVFQAGKAARRNLQLHFNAVHAGGQVGGAAVHGLHLDAVAVAGVVQDAFAERKAEGQLFQVLRRGHHHGM